MSVQDGFFYLFSAVLLFSGFRVVTARNPVHAVLFLMLAFSQAAALWLMLKAEFLGITLVLVYLGAVMVLFLFVVMMLDLNIDVLRKGFWSNFPLAALMGVLVSAELMDVLLAGFPNMTLNESTLQAPLHMADHENTRALGQLLYSQYLMPIQIGAVILLVAMVAAIALTLRHRKDSKAINPGLQVKVKAADRMAVVRMEASVHAQLSQVQEESKP